MRRAYFIWPFFILLLFTNVTAQSSTINQQRLQFEQALDALKNKDWNNFQKLSYQLKEYPLYHYLRYKYLKPRITKVSAYEIQSFLRKYGDTYFGNKLRYKWLKILAKQKDWRSFIQFYTPQKSVALQCYYAQARLMTGKDRRQALADAKKLWLVGKSQPRSCTPVFQSLYRSGQIGNTLIWKRIELAMKKNRLSLATTLSNRLTSVDRMWVSRWKIMHKNPAKTLASWDEADSAITRKIVIHGIKRLARKQFDRANDYWKTYQGLYAFSIKEIGKMQRDLALISVKHNHPLALQWLSVVHNNFLNKKVSKTRIKLALRRQNWRAVADFISEVPPAKRKLYHWYWLARALEQRGKKSEATPIFQKVANERDYYGFLAAKRIGAKYNMLHKPIEITAAEQQQFTNKLSIKAAYEFYKLSKYNPSDRRLLLNARREWHYTLNKQSLRLKAVAAAVAHKWQWHDRAILAAAKAKHYDDLDIRFPLAYRNQITNGAKRQYVDLAWVYGIIRQESIFMKNAGSHAGALGLMQLMPATARLVARKIGIRVSGRQSILEVNTNISLGTAYLRQMLDTFNGNYMLATAAYNAGPGRARRWAKQRRCMPADVWVEMIPFKETRNYVRRVLFYTRIFEERLGKRPRQLRVTLRPYVSCGMKYTQRSTDDLNS
jgi:soluble lytic murein transglycosylase